MRTCPQVKLKAPVTGLTNEMGWTTIISNNSIFKGLDYTKIVAEATQIWELKKNSNPKPK